MLLVGLGGGGGAIVRACSDDWVPGHPPPRDAQPSTTAFPPMHKPSPPPTRMRMPCVHACARRL